MQSKLAHFLNESFKYIIFFCIAFIWCNFYYSNFLICVIASIVISSIISFALSKIFYKKQSKKEISVKNKQTAQKAITQLLFYTNSEIIDYFYNVIKFSYENTQKNKSGIIVNSTFVIPCYLIDINIDDFLNIYKNFLKTKLNKLLILSYNPVPIIENFVSNIKNINVEIVSGIDVYCKIISPTKIYPQQKIIFKEPKKLRLKQILEVAFNRKNAKAYFFSGLFIMLASLFYTFSLYYQIFGSILFCFSLFSYYNKSFNKTINKTLFE